MCAHPRGYSKIKIAPWLTAASILSTPPGLECGHALADVLWGDTNPSGRLPVTIPNKENEIGFTTAQYPGTPTGAGKGAHLTSHYTERLLVGYDQVHVL